MALSTAVGRGPPWATFSVLNFHRIEHGGAFPSRLRYLAARQQIHVVSQPGFISELRDGFMEAFGPERSNYRYPFASLQAAGVTPLSEGQEMG